MTKSVATDDEMRTAMAQAMTGFARVVATIEPEHWELPSPCAGWTVFDVVDHVVAGERFTEAVLGGASLEEAVEASIGLDQENADVVGQLTDAAAIALAAFGGSLDRVIEHPVGPVSARRMLGFRIIDELGHTWDVATAIGQPVALDPSTLALGVEIAGSERATLDRSTNFATSAGDQVKSTDPLTTFLQTLGRTPTPS